MGKTSLKLSQGISVMGKVTWGLLNSGRLFCLQVWSFPSCLMLCCNCCRRQWLQHESHFGCGVHRLTQMWRIRQTYCYLHQAHRSHDVCIFTRSVIAHFSIYYYFIWNIFILFKAIHLMNKSGIIGVGLISWTRTLFDHSREEYDYLLFSKLYLMGLGAGNGNTF